MIMMIVCLTRLIMNVRWLLSMAWLLRLCLMIWLMMSWSWFRVAMGWMGRQMLAIGLKQLFMTIRKFSMPDSTDQSVSVGFLTVWPFPNLCPLVGIWMRLLLLMMMMLRFNRFVSNTRFVVMNTILIGPVLRPSFRRVSSHLGWMVPVKLSVWMGWIRRRW